MNYPCSLPPRPPATHSHQSFPLGFAAWLSILALCLSADPSTAAEAGTSLGLFEAHQDIGIEEHPGSATYNPEMQSYRLTGSGENMWFDHDALHFVWKKVSGDIVIASDIHWSVPGGNAHRKAGLIIRQSLEPGSVYVDAIVHGDGLASLQFRDAPGGPTQEIQGRFRAPERLQLERHGDFFTWSAGAEGAAVERAGGSIRIRLTDPVYVGLAVCSHDPARLEEAIFSRVELGSSPAQPITFTEVDCTLETVPISSGDRRAVFYSDRHMEAPNWSPDGASLFYNSQGRIWRYPLGGGTPEALDTGFAHRCNNDHGISPDGQRLAISDQSQTGQSQIYIVPIEGGTPQPVTGRAPSYWHGWSPDGGTVVYCAEREGEFDVYSIAVSGGSETRLTTAVGLDDGPEFSPDGRFIYFNSERTGRMQIWRMRPDGSHQEQVTFDDQNDWFPHPSPDGRWLVFLSYGPDVKGHPANQDVALRLLSIEGGEIRVLARLFGGQGTMNVPSWSPDSSQVAFVSYCPVFAARP